VIHAITRTGARGAFRRLTSGVGVYVRTHRFPLQPRDIPGFQSWVVTVRAQPILPLESALATPRDRLVAVPF
jgi:hypothetical protein